MEFKAKYGHDDNCTAGTMTMNATSLDDAIFQAREFVLSGLRDKTWMVVDFKESFYSVKNINGMPVGKHTFY